MDAEKLFQEYRQKKEKYIQRLEGVLEEELNPKELLGIAKGCSDILDSVVSMAKDLGLSVSSSLAADTTLDSLNDEELWRYLDDCKKAISADSLGDMEAESEN